ncbi:hypothetical protein NDU88_010960 [Pleurodeles waltl]|uniref:Uncharacterized protein n=1 Tax=Pleurodeles waltl TaxID=8319 RepID=A0AAV7R1P8_PLEWA|nr:hypothetical protein NDU88_010960 [Pleurodeles waltl]
MGTLSDVTGVEFTSGDLKLMTDYTAGEEEAGKDALVGDSRTDPGAEGESQTLPNREEDGAVVPGEGETRAKGTLHDPGRSWLFKTQTLLYRPKPITGAYCDGTDYHAVCLLDRSRARSPQFRAPEAQRPGFLFLFCCGAAQEAHFML